ncbi:cytosolic phospholipase A2-like [Physella acuta]|uniref:cytosolic phospholipase A2-like n=1 Tax=Physella acuta TaxID=109671 RepID=UPI0027DDD46D|nr:cytosolic phospholipase A2-like [Physella acuta]
MASDASFDPFQVFEVKHKHCAIVYVKVVRGRSITKGWAKDLVDTPDPYVILTLANSPYSWRKTAVKDNDVNPEWHETFTFWLDPEQDHVLEMSLMDANYTVDEHLASSALPLKPLPIGKKLQRTIYFNETSEVDIEVWGEMNEQADLRYSLTLCQEEKRFIEARKRKIHKVMRTHFGMGGPKNYKEVPVIGIIGSGGGFRAMVAFSGVMAALSEMGVLDMATYVGGLSGSSWYLSQLYSHPEWPNVSPGQQLQEIKHNIDHSFLWLFKTHGIYFVKEVWKKRSRGEPVSFTDLFGHLVGNTLLKNRLDARLSDQRKSIDNGQSPLPLYTCLHVKKSVSAMVFHEWMEFSPYEVGLPKYGTFLDCRQFACKFFMGCIVKDFPEPPLHYLQGIWGSAFCIQFKRLLQDDKNVDPAELMRREREEFEAELRKDLDVCDIDESESSEDENSLEKGTHGEKTTGGLQRRRSKSTKLKQKSFWDSMMARMMESRWFQSIELRAAQIFNFMRGLSLHDVFPFSPFTKTQEEENENNKETFEGIFEMHPTHIKKLYVVDSGLTFNSPYPVILRPQREVDIILSFDFSARPSDDTPPFKELLLAAKWAELNKVPFPPIDVSVIQKEGLKECYVFKHPWDPNCPIVLHFCLVNINFKHELRPGVPRTTQQEFDFANFSIFDDPSRPYSTFKFTYSHLEFDRLSKLMEYNTLLCQDIIFDNISTCIKRRRRFSIRRPCRKKDIARLSLNSRVKAEKLLQYISMVEEVSGIQDREEVFDEADSLRSVEHKSRPTSTPVVFQETAKLAMRRTRMTSEMSQVREEINELEEPNPSSELNNNSLKATLSHPVLRTPNLSTAGDYRNIGTPANNGSTNLDASSILQPFPSPRFQRKVVSLKTNLSPEIKDDVTILSKQTDIKNNDESHLVESGLKAQSRRVYRLQNGDKKIDEIGDCVQISLTNPQPLEEWIESVDRVTHL